MRPVLLLPEDLVPDDLVPEDLVELLLVVLLALDPDELLFFLTPLSLDERLVVLLLVELPLSLFPEFFVERADVPARVEVLFLAEDLLRAALVFLCFVSLSDRWVRTRFSRSEPVFCRLVPRWFVAFVDPRSKLLSPLSNLRVAPPEEVRSFVRFELWFVVLALRVAP